ncbi:hypothetical protein BGZ63DRAFT_394477 [Mariannaea sp. PMI_226]|nr:hypothetical protein BGZ63DRAFT_394477 [Mariannaea sp. PMI_226]
MEPNSLMGPIQGATPRKIFQPAHLTRYDSATGSISSEDPLARSEPSTRGQSPVRTTQRSRPVTPNSAPRSAASRIAVLLSASKRDSHDSFEIQDKHQGSLFPVILGSNSAPPAGREGLELPAGGPSLGSLASAYNNSPVAQSRVSPSGTYRGRGRPKGWRPGKPFNSTKVIPVTAAASRQMRQVKPIPPPNGYPKRRGRPPKPPSPQPREIYCKSRAPFLVFLCEWQGCKAELHNLDTLRRHVYIVHGQDTTCLWANCAHAEAPLNLYSDRLFKAHMEEAHLVPFAWHVGDGPSNTSGTKTERGTAEEDNLPDYLKDENGNQVTPSVRDQRVEDFATWKLNRRRLKELLIRRDENLQSAESDVAMESEKTQ